MDLPYYFFYTSLFEQYGIITGYLCRRQNYNTPLFSEDLASITQGQFHCIPIFFYTTQKLCPAKVMGLISPQQCHVLYNSACTECFVSRSPCFALVVGWWWGAFLGPCHLCLCTDQLGVTWLFSLLLHSEVQRPSTAASKGMATTYRAPSRTAAHQPENKKKHSFIQGLDKILFITSS